MEDFSRFSIHHIALEDLEHGFQMTGNRFVVIWFRSLPLGHIWMEESTGTSGSDLFRLIGENIRPSLMYYFSMAHAQPTPPWQELLAEGKYGLLAQALANALASSSSEKTHAEKTLSVIVCTHNRPDALRRCLQSLMRTGDMKIECIIVDNAPADDRTLECTREFPRVRYVKEPIKGLDRARNTGIRHAAGEIIAFVDDDVQVKEDWIARTKEGFDEPLTMAVTGLVFPLELDTKSQYLFERYWGFNKGYVPRTFDKNFFDRHRAEGVPVWDIGAGANMAFRRSVFELVGLFDERLEAGAAGCSGDSEFWYRIVASGYNCLYLPWIVAFHQHRRTMPELRKQQYNYARGHACALMVEYERFGNRGELNRLFRILPGGHFKRIMKHLARGHWRNLRSVWTEASGTAAGWLYYWRHKSQADAEAPLLDPSRLFEPSKPDQSSLVSVIIPCYNHVTYLPDAIRSAQDQTHPHIEIIVVDDGSTTDVRSICALYPVVRYVRIDHAGVSAARNIGVAHAQGEYLVFLDADDLLLPDGIATNLSYFRQNPGLAYVSGAHKKMDAQGKELPVLGPYDKPDDNYRALLSGNYIGMEATVMYRRQLFFTFHFDPTLQGSEDYDLNLQIARQYRVLGHVEQIAIYRIHPLNTTRDMEMMSRMTLRVLDRQKKNLRNGREIAAYRRGRKGWKAYYRNQTANY